MELIALGPDFGVEVRGIDLIDVASSDAAHRATRAALEEHSLLLFREQEVTNDVQAAFSRAFGPLERVKIGSVGAGTFYSRRHTWRPGDVVMWDNRATMHRGLAWPQAQARSMVRTTISAVDADGLAELRPGA